jgi:hypothetical protein
VGGRPKGDQNRAGSERTHHSSKKQRMWYLPFFENHSPRTIFSTAARYVLKISGANWATNLSANGPYLLTRFLGNEVGQPYRVNNRLRDQQAHFLVRDQGCFSSRSGSSRGEGRREGSSGCETIWSRRVPHGTMASCAWWAGVRVWMMLFL